MMRFLVFLTLMKCAAPSVISPANHKTVSVPIGNGMNVDVDVTVDIDTSGTAGNGGVIPSPEKCYPDGHKVLELQRPCPYYCCSQYCCTGVCGRCKENPCKHEGEYCKNNDECCPDLKQHGNTQWENFCTDNKCVSKRVPGLKPCKEEGGYCENDEECCRNYDFSLWENYCTDNKCVSKRVPGLKPCKEYNERCEEASECCDEDAICRPPLDRSPFGPWGHRCFKGKSEEPDCIPDGEPCHGTDDWEHECCSESCCEGKCGKCKPVLWNY